MLRQARSTEINFRIDCLIVLRLRLLSSFSRLPTRKIRVHGAIDEEKYSELFGKIELLFFFFFFSSFNLTVHMHKR